MSEPTADPAQATDPATPPAGTPPAAPEAPKPPWGSDEDFDPQKAWDLIQNLREDNKKTAELRAEVKKYEDERLTETQKASRDLEESRTEIATLASENAVLKAVVAHPELTADDIDLLQGIPADAVAERAAKLAARVGAGTPKPPPSGRPSEALRGGGDPTAPAESNDWLRDALARSN